MDCSANIFAKVDPDRFLECIAPEETKFDRSGFTVNKIKDGVEFRVTAKDPVALRATLNTISQLLIVYDGVAKRK